MNYVGVLNLIKQLEKSESEWTYIGDSVKVDKLIRYAMSNGYRVFANSILPLSSITIHKAVSGTVHQFYTGDLKNGK